jgi:MoxR-like ATPase
MANRMAAIVDNVEKIIIGKRQAVELVVLALISGGHVLIEDVPGVGKTSLISALARSISCGFKRIQFTPDIMPSDLTGFSVYNQKTGEFEFRPGALMSNFILADEINRAPAKTQASLLEAMEERQITVDSHTYALQEPFLVLATQNPVDSYGTYPLPEAQIDRFLIKLSMGYPAFEDELRVISKSGRVTDALKPAADAGDILALRAMAESVYVSSAVARYILEIVTATRSHPDLILGSSPRGGIALYDLCRACALYRGRDYVLPDDVKYLAPFALSHRLILTHEARINRRSGPQIIADILESIIVPAAI